MPLGHDAPCRRSLQDTFDAMRVVGPPGFDDAEREDYADLGDAELPKDAAVHLADMTGRPVAEFEPDAPIPDFDEQEVNSE